MFWEILALTSILTAVGLYYENNEDKAIIRHQRRTIQELKKLKKSTSVNVQINK